MNDTHITSSTAKLAKNAGFNHPTFGYYIKIGRKWELQFEDLEKGAYNWNDRAGMSAPTQAQLQTWLRNARKISVEVNYKTFGVETCNGYYFHLMLLPTKKRKAMQIGAESYGMNLFHGFKTYEKALEEGLLTVLSLSFALTLVE
jgi:hypothetical protein